MFNPIPTAQMRFDPFLMLLRVCNEVTQIPHPFSPNYIVQADQHLALLLRLPLRPLPLDDDEPL